MPSTVSNRWLVCALYANAALLAVIAVLLAGRSGSILPAAYGQNQLPIGGGAGVFIVPAQFAGNNYGCYLMDIDQQTLCAYEYLPGERQIRLIAARSFKYDRQLGNFNTASPSPDEVKDLVEKQKQSERAVAPDNQPKPSPETPANP